MASISVSKAWDETKAFIARERRLIVPVVLATVFLPTLVFELLVPQPSMAVLMAGKSSPSLLWLTYGLLFVQLIGGSSLILMALGSRATVGATIVHGARRAIVVVLAFILAALIAIPVLVVGMIIAGIGGGVPTSPTAMPPGFLAIFAVIALVMALVMLRVVLFVPAAVVEPIGAWTALKRGWNLGRGNGSRLIATMALLIIGTLVLSSAATAVVGSVALLVSGSTSGTSVGGILVALVGTAIGSAVFLVQYSMLAFLYRQAAGEAAVIPA